VIQGVSQPEFSAASIFVQQKQFANPKSFGHVRLVRVVANEVSKTVDFPEVFPVSPAPWPILFLLLRPVPVLAVKVLADIAH
jgi:hypothetical protein